MKKILSLILIFAALFSFASCKGNGNGGDTKTTTYAVPVIKESSYSKEFTDESGRVVFTIDVVVPEITGKCDPKVADYLNGIALDIFNNACKFAESNLEEASKNTKPWSKKVTFETTFLDNHYACFLISDVFSVNGDIPTLSTLCYDIRKGQPRDIWDFAVNQDDPQSCFDFFVSDTVSKVLQKRFHVSSYITDEVLDRLDQIMSPDNFYLTEDGMGFYFDKALVDYRLSGNFKMKFTWTELTSYFAIPE